MGQLQKHGRGRAQLLRREKEGEGEIEVVPSPDWSATHHMIHLGLDIDRCRPTVGVEPSRIGLQTVLKDAVVEQMH